jgi:glycosyltransferase involved in cell wall biosynthesis
MRGDMMRLSVALATYNEEENIGRCLEAVKDLADEVIIIDGSSTDKTVAIAKSYGAKITVTNNPPIFHLNKQKALDLCQGEWILQLDADEEVTKKLAEEIKKVIKLSPKELTKRKLSPEKKKLFLRHQRLIEARDGRVGQDEGEVVAFWIPRRNYFMGRCLIHGGVYPDGVIRLVRMGKAKFPCKSVHEQIEIKGRTAWLENDLIHYDSPTFGRYLERADRYTSLTAKRLKKEGIKVNLLNDSQYFLLKPLQVFFSLYFRHKGFLDGFPGFVWGLFSGLHYPIAYIKYWEETSLKK